VPRRPSGSRTDSVWHRPTPAPSKSASNPAISREEITRAAIELADSHGLEAVSMRRIADRIGCAPTSIYWYVSDKSELYELMFDAVLGEVELPNWSASGWRADLASVAWATLVTARRHRWWFSQVSIQPVPGPNTLRYAAVILPILAKSGIDEVTGTKVLATLHNYIVGFVQREATWRELATRSEANGIAEAGGANGTGQQAGDPLMSAQWVSARLGLAGDEGFEFGLERFLDGIAVLIDSLGHSQRAAGALLGAKLSASGAFQPVQSARAAGGIGS
jgi:AcrR family transcriptional regulator